MIIEIDGYTLPDIPDSVLTSYPYLVILSSNSDDSGTAYIFFAYTNEFIYSIVGDAKVYTSYDDQEFDNPMICGLTNTNVSEWTLCEDFTVYNGLEMCIQSNEYGINIVYSNHDIYVGTFNQNSVSFTKTNEIHFLFYCNI